VSEVLVKRASGYKKEENRASMTIKLLQVAIQEVMSKEEDMEEDEKQFRLTSEELNEAIKKLSFR
jgi:FtsZ-binding cell division protein ZapB